MKWIYGKRDYDTLQRGQENCWLMTNGLGGFSSMTMLGSVTRSDHAVLMACTQAPNYRYNVVHRLEETITTGEKEYWISSQEFADGHCEDGYRYLSEFSYEDTPVWRFQINGIEIRKEMGLKEGKNTAAVCYEIRNRSMEVCSLTVVPYFQFRKKGSNTDTGWRITKSGNCISGGQIELYVRTNGKKTDFPEKEEIYHYAYDACDGRRAEGKAYANHRIEITVKPGDVKTLSIVFELKKSQDTAESIIESVRNNRRRLVKKAGLEGAVPEVLVKSAAQFLSSRKSTGGKTILAGFPFFEDWGRDTMIALPGICLTTKQYDAARSILRTFAVNEKDGLMPNLFPEGKNEPMYNTADAALLFINCVYLYYGSTGDAEFVKEMYPVMERIIKGYMQGTGYGIHMDQDGLIMAGEGLDQVTWMDVRMGDILPTPRHGKPVEINAYWYNALCIMLRFAFLAEKDGSMYANLAERVKESFRKQFWIEEKGYLKDVISGTKADIQFRCNQIWAVSLPFTMLDKEKEQRIVESVYEKLYTPYGLRTLDKDDPEFHPYYGGDMVKRDMAYHQGTVWVFPLGAYYLAYLKIHNYDEKSKRIVKEQLEVIESALREGCIGQLPEIYDGENPTFSRGCFAQAWSVGEILRVYEKLNETI
ncbi:amylo-alpha-1,6-glucosidase [Fusicatenibacter saccharivorans]|uniref:amylo-alpha-1,6-glucosidase n=1 Tax=Fusicatenibacter saccharivorans TaxID=1150298 RepID=UPI003D08AA07